MSNGGDGYARTAKEILNQTLNPAERKIITYMMLDKTFYEIKDALIRDGVESPADRYLTWRNLEEHNFEFFVAYRQRQHRVSPPMTFIPTPLSESGVPLAPGPQVNWRSFTQTQQDPSDTSIAVVHGQNTSQILNGDYVDVDYSRLLGAMPGWFSLSVEAAYRESYGGEGFNWPPATTQLMPNTRAPIVQQWAPNNMGGPSHVRERSTSFSVTTSHGAGTSQNLFGANIDDSGFSIWRAADANLQDRAQYQGTFLDDMTMFNAGESIVEMWTPNVGGLNDEMEPNTSYGAATTLYDVRSCQNISGGNVIDANLQARHEGDGDISSDDSDDGPG